MNHKDIKEMRECIIKIEDEPYELREQLYEFLRTNHENIYNDSYSCLLLEATTAGFPTFGYSRSSDGEWCGTKIPHTITISKFLEKYGLVDIYATVPPRISFRQTLKEN